MVPIATHRPRAGKKTVIKKNTKLAIKWGKLKKAPIMNFSKYMSIIVMSTQWCIGFEQY